MILADAVCATYSMSGFLDVVRAATALRTMRRFDVLLYYVTVQDPIYEYGNFTQATAEDGCTLE